MKFFSIVFSIILVGLAKAQKNPADESSHAMCMYSPNEALFGCKSGTAVVKCSAKAVMPPVIRSEKLFVFGIGPIPGRPVTNDPSMSYRLYPRKIEDQTYINDIEMSISSGPIRGMGGIQIIDTICYQNLVRLFNDAARIPHIAKSMNGKDIPLLGEMFFMDKELEQMQQAALASKGTQGK